MHQLFSWFFKIKSNKLLFFIFLTCACFIVIVILDRFDCKFSWHDILVESHGLLFDLIIFGLIIGYYELKAGKRERIIRYKEEIDDLRGLKTPYARHRISGLVSRLVRLDAQPLNLINCDIIHSPFGTNVKNWVFSNSNFYSATCMNTRFESCCFISTNFNNSKIYHAHFTDCDLRGSIWNNSILLNCRFSNVNFLYAYVESKNWFKELKNSGNKGVESLEEKFKISINSIKINGKNYYQVLKKDDSNLKARTLDEEGLGYKEYIKLSNDKLASALIHPF